MTLSASMYFGETTVYKMVEKEKSKGHEVEIFERRTVKEWIHDHKTILFCGLLGTSFGIAAAYFKKNPNLLF